MTDKASVFNGRTLEGAITNPPVMLALAIIYQARQDFIGVSTDQGYKISPAHYTATARAFLTGSYYNRLCGLLSACIEDGDWLADSPVPAGVPLSVCGVTPCAT